MATFSPSKSSDSIHPDGREVIFDGDTKKIITDPKYVGTYNYVSPKPIPNNIWSVRDWVDFGKSNIKHGIKDVAPYFFFRILGENGNTRSR